MTLNLIKTIVNYVSCENASTGPIEIGHFYKQSFLSIVLILHCCGLLALSWKSFSILKRRMPYHLFAPERFLATIDEVESIVSMPEATFAIIHLMKPHLPTVFDERGELIKIKRPSHGEYFAEFGFTNSKFLQMIDTILDGSSNEAGHYFPG